MARDRATDDPGALLDELRTTLDELDRTLETRDDENRRPRASRRSPAPPRGRDVVRFTEEYTIPTAISVLETTIASLELLRGLLRLTDSERRRPRSDDDSRGVDHVDRRVVERTERALDDLRRVVTGTEEPSDPLARDVFREARELTAEIESMLDDSRDRTGPSRPRHPRRESDRHRDRRGVTIPVEDEDERERRSATDTEPTGTVDVDAELESIRDEVDAESAAAERVGEDDGDAEEPNSGDEG